MDLTIAGVLTVDGLTNGAVYALLGMGIVLLFSVTRIIFIPQGEFVAFGALTLASLQAGKVPGTVWLLLGLTLAGVIGVWGWIGLLPLATGLFRFCPAYPLLGISTCGRADSCCGKDSCKK